MRVMVIVKASKDSEAGQMPSEQMLRDMGTYNEQLVNAGVMKAGEGLHPSSKGKRVKFSGGGKTTVYDGPFAETKELIAGYWVIDVKSREEALEWAKRVPFQQLPSAGRAPEIELRQMFEVTDFPDVPQEVADLENALRGKRAEV